jgi:hypothetical protein
MKLLLNLKPLLLGSLSALLLLTGCSNTEENLQDELLPQSNQSDQTHLPLDLNSYELTFLTEDMKYSLAFMWFEEKMARDLYTILGESHSLKSMQNIKNTEQSHMNAVEQLIERYDINVTNINDFTRNYSKTELANLPIGTFALQEIESLYTTLLEEGTPSPIKALQVGCKVEVLDITDLKSHMQHAPEDFTAVYSNLLDGSYNHYFAFDNALKNVGVSTGCCSLGEKFCKTDEYPKNESRNRNAQREQQGRQ